MKHRTPNLAYKILFAMLIPGIIIFQGCFSGSPDEPGAKASPYTGPPLELVLIPTGHNSNYWNNVHAGAKQATKDLGKVKINWRPPVGDELTANQIQTVHDTIHSKIDGIILAPTDPGALVFIVDESIKAGIPVLVFGTRLETGPEIASHVTTNHAIAGQLAAEAMADAIDDQGNVILLRYLFNDEATRRRDEGILDELTKYKKIKIVSSDQRGGENNRTAKQIMGELLAIFGHDLDGIIVSSGANADGALAALREMEQQDESLKGKIKFITFDPSTAMANSIDSGHCTAVVVQDPFEIGYRSVATLVKQLSGKKVRPFIATGEYVITSDNIGDRKSKRLLGR